MVICLELGADLHIAQLMPLTLTVCCFSKIQIGFTFLVLAHLGSPGQRAVKRVCVFTVTGREVVAVCDMLAALIFYFTYGIHHSKLNDGAASCYVRHRQLADEATVALLQQQPDDSDDDDDDVSL